MKKFYLHLIVYTMVSTPFVLAQTSTTITPAEPKSTLEAKYQEIKEKVKVDEQNIQRMEDKKKDTEAQLDVDKATLKKYKAQLKEDHKRADRIKEQLNLEEEE